MKIRTDFVTNSSSTSFIFEPKDGMPRFSYPFQTRRMSNEDIQTEINDWVGSYEEGDRPDGIDWLLERLKLALKNNTPMYKFRVESSTGCEEFDYDLSTIARLFARENDLEIVYESGF